MSYVQNGNIIILPNAFLHTYPRLAELAIF